MRPRGVVSKKATGARNTDRVAMWVSDEDARTPPSPKNTRVITANSANSPPNMQKIPMTKPLLNSSSAPEVQLDIQKSPLAPSISIEWHATMTRTPSPNARALPQNLRQEHA